MNEPSQFLYIVNLNNASDIDVENGIFEASWEEFRDSLMNHRIRKYKDGAAFLPVMMKAEHEWQLCKTKKNIEHYRFDVNIEAITALVIDIDKPGALEVAEQLFEGYEYVVYSTHNFTPDTPWKYRLVARLDEPILVEDWRLCFESLKSRIELDSSCCNPSRCYYYPSHSVESHISPRAFYRMGKAITRDEIFAMGTDTVKASLSPMRLRTLGTLPIQSVRARRHFSGKVIGHYDKLPTVLANERKDYDLRHAKSIAEYAKDDSRHNLALSITSREYYMLGPRTDVRALLLFLYQVAATGGKPLEAGNTVDELPDMIVSAMQKYAPEAYEKMLENYGEKSLSWLVDEIDWAQRNYETIHQRAQAKEPSSDEGDLKVYRQRHLDLLQRYVETGDFKALVSDVMNRELKEQSPAYKELAKALMMYCNGYETKVAKCSNEEAQIKVASQIKSVADGIKQGDDIGLKVEDKKRTFMRSALLVELAKIRKKEQQSDPSPHY